MGEAFLLLGLKDIRHNSKVETVEWHIEEDHQEKLIPNTIIFYRLSNFPQVETIR